MKKRIFSIIAGLMAVTVLTVAGYAALVLYPHPLFDYETNFGQVGVLSQRPLTPKISNAVEEAVSIISESELYDPKMELGIVLAHDHIYHRITPGKVLAYAIGPYAIMGGKVDGRENALFWEKSPARMNLTAAIAHELIHCLQGKHHGYYAIKYRTFPWKREGYAEYVASRKIRLSEDYSLIESLDQLLSPEKIEPVKGWIRLEDGFDRPITYYRFRLMTEYLFDVEKVSYKEFMEVAEFHDVYNRMLAWREAEIANTME